MNSFRVLLAAILCILALPVTGQNGPTHSDRLKELSMQLDLLGDSLSPGLNELANFSVSGISIQTFLRSVAESHRLNIQIDPSITVSLTNNFTNVMVKDLLLFLCETYELDVRFINNIMSFSRFQHPKPPERVVVYRRPNISFNQADALLSFDLTGDSLRTVARELTRITNKNVVVSGGGEMESRLVRAYIRNLPLENALDKLAYTNGLRLTKTKDGVYILESNNPASPTTIQSAMPSPLASSVKNQLQGDITVQDSLVSIDVANYPISDIINKASSQLGINYILFSELSGNTTAKVSRVRYGDLLAFLFQGTNFTYKKRNAVYLIGQRSHEGFKTTEFVRLDFRTIEGIEKEIPSELQKEVEIKMLKDLNGLIVTGTRYKIDELISFLRLIDKPIPNILIEVIVANTRKGFSVETGIKAFLSSDSIPATQGQILGGVDVTLSSKSINNLLGKAASNGIINLGKVTPQFYATLKAMEKNNNINVRSTPKLSTMNGSKANLTIGESVYYVEQTQNITGGVNPITTTSQRFNKVEANLSISISPVVSGNEHVTLEIQAEFSDFVKPTIQNAPPGNSTRKFESKIRIRNEEMIILGGLEEISRNETSSGVPVLSRIPVLKWLFSSKTKDSTNNQLIVFIKPTIVY